MKKALMLLIALFTLFWKVGSVEAVYENYVNNIPGTAAVTAQTQDIQQELEAKVQEMVSAGHMAPTLYYIGLGGNPIMFYNTPTETIYTLSAAYPYLSTSLKTAVKTYLDNEITNFPPHSQKYYYGFNGNKSGDLPGARREYFTPNPAATFWYSWEAATPLFLPTLYAIWAYSNNTNDWTYVTNNYAALRTIYTEFKATGGITSYPELAGAIGFARIAQHQGNTADYNDALIFAEAGFTAGVNFDQFLATSKIRYPQNVAATIQGYSIPLFMFHRQPAAILFSREIGQFLKDHALVQSTAYANQILRDVPLAWLTAGGISHGESAYTTPEIPWTYFMLRSAVGDDVSQLKTILDKPDRKGDLLYIQKLVAIIEATPVGPCILTSASWSTNAATTGSSVTLTANSSGSCSGQSVTFEVRRNGLGDDLSAITNQPNPQTITFSGSNQFSTTWVAEHQPYWPGTDPDYYFKATLSGGNTLDTTTSLLHVTNPVGGTPTPTPTPIVITTPTSSPTATTSAGSGTPTPTASASATPTAAPSPTPTPQPCTLNSVSWSNITTTVGSPLGITVNGTNCGNQAVNLEVRRFGSTAIDDIPANIQPDPVSFASGSAQLTTTWTAERVCLIQILGVCSGDPTYYVKATVNGVSIDNKANMVTVTAAQAGVGPQVTAVTDNASTYPNSQVPQYSKYELSFAINNIAATNLDLPYDIVPPPGVRGGIGISVDGLFTSPSGKTSVQPGFIYQDYQTSISNNRESYVPIGQPVWKIRFAPTEAGVYKYKIRVTDSSGTNIYPANGDLSFTAAASQSDGYINNSKNDPRYFEFDSGKTFIGAGHDEGWDATRFRSDVDEKMAKFAASRFNFTRVWMGGSSIVGAAWLPWGSYHLSYNGYLPPTSLSAEEAYGSGDFSLKLSPRDAADTTGNPCMFAQGYSVQPNKTYRIQARVKTVGLVGPVVAGSPYGFVVKNSGWIGRSCGQANTLPALTQFVDTNSNWQLISNTFTTNASQNNLDINMILENVSAGAAYIDEISLKEDLGGGNFGPEIIRKGRMNMHQYFDPLSAWNWDYAVEQAEKNGVYLKLVALEKDEWIYNHFDWNGNKVVVGTDNAGDANFYGDPNNPNTATRRYQEYFWRYMSARWGYSTAIHSWELLNEGDPFNGNHYAQADYFAKFMHALEPARHLVTTSLWAGYPVNAFWNNPAYPNIDYADVHMYAGGTNSYTWTPLTGTYLETNPINVMGGQGGSIRVPAGRTYFTGYTNSFIQGRGIWNISVWMKTENFVGVSNWGLPSNLDGPQLMYTLGDYHSRVVPNNPADPDKTFIPTNDFTGTNDWKKFSQNFEITDDNYHNFNFGFKTDFATAGTAWFDNLEITSPDGRKYSVLGDGTFDDYARTDYDSALFSAFSSNLFGAKSLTGSGKPLVRGETGITTIDTLIENPDLARDTQGIWFHKFTWGQVNPGGMYELYWWTGNIRQYNLYTHMKPYRDFMEGIPLSNGNYQDALASSSNLNLRAWGQKDAVNGRAHLWIDNKNHTWKNVVDGVVIAPVSGIITLPGMPAGTYTVSWFDTYAGIVLKTENVVADASGNITLNIQNLATDAAVKIENQSIVVPTPTPTAVPTPTSTPTATPTPTPTSTPATITLNPATTYQTFTGWEGTDFFGEWGDYPGNPYSKFSLYKDSFYDKLVNEYGLNRIRLEMPSGVENSTDYYKMWADETINPLHILNLANGQLDQQTYVHCYAYNGINDDNDPNNINPAGFQFSSLDWKINDGVLPLKQRLEANGEKLFVNLNLVSFNFNPTRCPAGVPSYPTTFRQYNTASEYAELMLATFQHMQTKYGFVPDTIEMILEPDNRTSFSGTLMGSALQATQARLAANGFNPKYVVPSTINMTNALIYFNNIRTVIGDASVRNYIQEISYHRYQGATDTNLQAIANASVTYGIGTSMLEWWDVGNTYLTLHKDLKLGRNSAWQQGTLLGIYTVNIANPTNPVITTPTATQFIRQYTKFIREGAVRIDAASANASFDPVAFINKNGGYVVVVNALAGGNFSVGNLPAGTYGIKYTTATQYNIDQPDQTITAGQNISTSIPAVGAITIYSKTPTGGVPTATPTPIPTPAPCTLASASWNPISTTQGSSVALNVTTSGSCSATDKVSFTISKNGLCGGPLTTTINPNPADIASGSATASWVSEYTSDICGIGGSPNQYYFTATTGSSSIDTKTNLLSVSPAQGGVPSPTPTPPQTTVPKPAPLISRTLPVSASSGRAIDANDGSYGTFWTAIPSAWLAFDVSSLTASQKAKTLLLWTNDGLTADYDDTIASTGYNGVPSAYVIEGNNAAGGGSVPTTGWVTLTSVTNNPYHSRQHLLDLTGYNWVRLNVSGVRDALGGTQAKINVDLHDASLGLEDDWIIYGDSFTAFGLDHGLKGTTGNLAQLINSANNNYYPIYEAAGSNGEASGQALPRFNTWLSLFPGKYVALAYGTNDALDGRVTPSAYYSNMATMVQAVIAAGKIPVVPKIPWGNGVTLQTRAPLLNAEIDRLYTNFPQIIPGPDLWTFFQTNQNLIDAGGLHPTFVEGYAALRQQWANTMLTSVYNQAVGGIPTATPTPTPIPTPCTINNVSWPAGMTSIPEGSNVNISVTASGGCALKQVHLTVRRQIAYQTDADALNQSNPRDITLTLNANNTATASASWRADSWSNACTFPLTCNPTFFAKGQLINPDGTYNTEVTTDRNNDLSVTQSVIVPTSPNDWPQVQKDAQRTGYSAETLGTNIKNKFTYPFQPDRVHPQVQAIIYQGKVFVGTEGANGQKPTLYAIDAVNADPASPAWQPKGKVIWRFEAGGPILNSAAAYDNKIFFGSMDGAVYAVDSNSGTQVWKNQLSSRFGFSTAPVVAENKVMLGGRDGNFYALDPNSGSILWQYNAGSPILQTAAYDQGKAFFGTKDMYVHGVNTVDGSSAWKSQRIPGIAFKDYWPMVTQGKVIIIPMADRPGAGLRTGFPVTWFQKGTATEWAWLSQWGPVVATGGATLVPEIMNVQDTVISNYQARPGNYTKNFFILDENTGSEAMTVPSWNDQTMNGATAPPCVDRTGNLIVPVMFVNGRWGSLDLNLGRITDIFYDGMDGQGQPLTFANFAPRGGGNADENMAVSCAANSILAFHFQESKANFTGVFNLDSRMWIAAGLGNTNGAKNLQMGINTQGGGTNPASISNGMIYHIMTHELVVRSTN